MAFKYHADYRWDYPKGFWNNIIDFFYWIKWFIQRGWRGYADCDVWGVDYYLIKVMLPMLKQLKERKHGYPGTLTSARWDKIMDKMIAGLEAGDRFNNDEYLDIIQPNWADDFKTKSMAEALNNHPITKESWKKYNQMTKKDEKKFHEAMRLINIWFFALWD